MVSLYVMAGGVAVAVATSAWISSRWISKRSAEALELAGRLEATLMVTPVALWEEDFGAVAAWVATLTGAGEPDDLRRVLTDDPDLVDFGIGLIRIVRMNPAAVRMVDTPSGTLLFGGDSTKPITPETRAAVVEQFLTVAREEGSLNVEISGSSDGGDPVHAELHWQAAKGPGGTFDYSRVVVAIVDVSDRVEAANRLRSAVESKDALIAAVSHELRTPLTGILGYALLLRDDERAVSDAERASMSEIVAQQAEEVSHLVEDLLTSARHESGALTVAAVKVVLRSQAAQVIEQLHLPEAEGVELSASGVSALADPGRVRQIVRNLITNAIRHGGSRIRIEMAEQEARALLRVLDDGEGVSAGNEEAIFEPYRGVATEPGQPGSIGLGLSVSRDLARLMGGDLTYARDGADTVFELVLPAESAGG